MMYFAYGSNMLRERLMARVGEVDRLGCAYLSRYRLTFHKRGNDGSGKCTVVDSGDDDAVVWGTLFDLNLEQKLILDRCEGNGYEAREVITTQNNIVVNAYTYVSLYAWTDRSCQPYSWYKALVIAGAIQSVLPPAYVASIQGALCMEDPNCEREHTHHDLISASGYGQIVAETGSRTCSSRRGKPGSQSIARTTSFQPSARLIRL